MGIFFLSEIGTKGHKSGSCDCKLLQPIVNMCGLPSAQIVIMLSQEWCDGFKCEYRWQVTFSKTTATTNSNYMNSCKSEANVSVLIFLMDLP